MSGEERGAAAAETTAGGGVPRWLKVALGTVALAVVLYLGAALAFRALLDPERLAGWAEPRAEAALNRDVELEGVRPVFFPGLGVEVTGLQVNNLPDFEGPPLARVERLRLRVALLPLLRRQIRVDEVRIQDPVLRLAVDPAGRTNYGDLVPAEEGPAEDDAVPRAPVELDVRSFGLSGGRLEYASAPDSVEVALDRVSARASLGRRDDGTWRLSASTEAPRVRVRHPLLGGRELPFRRLALETEVTAGPDFAWLQVQDGTVHLEEAALSLTGRVEALDEPVRRVDLRLAAEALDVGQLVTFLPDSVREALPGAPGGRLSVDASLRGEAGPDVRPRVDGTVRLVGGSLAGPGGGRLAEGVVGTFGLSDDSATVRELEGTLLGGPFAVSGGVRTDSLLGFRARVEASPRLEEATALAELAEGTELGGTAVVRLTLAGRATALHESRVDGTVSLEDVRATHPGVGVPVRVAAGTLAFGGQGVRWEELEVELGPDRVVSSGRLDAYLAGLDPDEETLPRLDAEARSPHLDLDRVFPPEGDTAITYGQLAFARMGGRSLEGRSPDELARDLGYARPAPIPMVGEVRLAADTLRSAPYTLTGAGARVAFSPELVRVSEITAGLFGGRISGELGLGLGEDPIQPFTVNLRVEAVEAADFLSATSPLGRKIAGRLGMELSFGGGLDTLLLPDPTSVSGDGRARATDGRIVETPLTARLARSLAQPVLASPGFRDWTGPFRLEGTNLLFDDARLDLESGELRYGGLVGFGGNLDLGVRFAVPAARVDSAALARSGFARAVAGRVGGETPLVRLGLRVRGTLSDPRIEPEASLAAGDLRQALEAEARERAERLRADARERLQRPADTARARAEALRDTATERAQAVRDTAAERLEAERRAVEERTRQEAERAREDLRERGRGLLRGLLGGRDTARAAADTGAAGGAGPADSVRRDTLPPDTTRDGGRGASGRGGPDPAG